MTKQSKTYLYGDKGMILDGKLVSETIKQTLKTEVETAINVGKRAPHLIIITVGDDPASKVYVRNKVKACNDLQIVVNHVKYEATTPSEVIIEDIHNYNNDSNVDGIMVQLPLPQGYDERKLIDCIDPEKDVDGLTTINIGKLRSGQSCIKPCTAAGVIDLLHHYNINLDGKDVTIIGRSNIVGKPLADLMMLEGATVTQCHSRTKDLTNHCCSDIIVSAIGKPKFITKKHIWQCSLALVDVGINRDENGKLCGDIDFEAVEDYCDYITPVPGGVGPMTVVELMKNTVECWRKNI